MTETTRFAPEERPAKIQEALNAIGSWLLATVQAEPGWNELVLDIKPLTDSVFVRVVESRDDQDYVGSVGPLKSTSKALPEIHKLQQAAYDEVEGTWFTATVVVAAKDWPNPQYQIGAAYNRQEEPQDWEGEGRLTARELRAHLAEFPRAEERIPDWARQRLEGRRTGGSSGRGEDAEVPNPYLVVALEAIEPGQRTDSGVVNVLRASLGGEILMDITGSELVAEGQNPAGPQSRIEYKTLILSNGMRAVCAFSSSEYLLNHAEATSPDVQPLMMRENATKILMDFVQDSSTDLLVIDPGTDHETFIEKPQAGWVLSTPFNDSAKRALMTGDMQLLLSSLAAPGAFLLMGVRLGTDTPIFVPSTGDEDPDTMLAFTSAAEVAAVDPSLEVRSAPALEVLKFAQQMNATGIRINAANPSATLPIEQVRELISLVEDSQA